MSDSNIGHSAEFDKEDITGTAIKAILDFGLLDVDQNDIDFIDTSLEYVGITSDMLVIDLGKNKTKEGSQRYKIGDKIHFKPNYMAVARLLNSKFIDKMYV